MKKRQFPGLVLAGLCLLFACGCGSEPENKFFDLEDEVSTAFFDYRVEEITVHRNYHGMQANEGHQIVVVDLEIENTEDYELPMGRYDFRVQWGAGEEDYAYPETWYYQRQFPNEYSIPEERSAEGELVFQVPREQREMTLAYLEVFENETQGDVYFTYFTVEGGANPEGLRG